MNIKCIWTLITLMLSAYYSAANAQNDSIGYEQQLKEVVINATKGNKSRYRVDNTEIIGQQQLIRAACCNLGESFTTNPSVDVSYSDATTGARQIKLLGLSGTYVQMLTENIPNLRGASIPYSLGFVPGPWMQSIQVSKGASSVKNGYESTTGQINIEFLKPQGEDKVRANAYIDSQLKYELNADGNIHLNDRLSTSMLLHYEDRQRSHDGNNDGFMDMPKQRQMNAMWRMAYVSPQWISQLSIRLLNDKRRSGQDTHHAAMPHNMIPYETSIDNSRYEAQWKNGFTLNTERNESVALMLHASWHDAWNSFGMRQYDVTQKNSYAQLMYESDITEHHNIAVGGSLNYDRYDESWSENIDNHITQVSAETTPGAYAQYTYKNENVLTVMAGIRYDHSSIWGGFITPRIHIKYSPWDILTIRASAGKGYRTAHALAENSPMLATGRYIVLPITDDGMGTFREEAWNYGISAGMNIPLCGKNLEVNAEYYYTDFIKQMIANVHPSTMTRFEQLGGKSYSHTIQVDATYPFFEGFTMTGAFRMNDVRTTYDGILQRKPLTSRYKGLITLSYKTNMELWHFDVTGHLNGSGELYDHTTYPAYFQLQAQVTRDFRIMSIYIGGENLTNYRIPTPIINARNPWSQEFDATQIWGPTEGAMAYVGIRLKL